MADRILINFIPKLPFPLLSPLFFTLYRLSRSKFSSLVGNGGVEGMPSSGNNNIWVCEVKGSVKKVKVLGTALHISCV